MKKRLAILLSGIFTLLSLVGVWWYSGNVLSEEKPTGEGMETNLKGRTEWEVDMLADPNTQHIPGRIRNLEIGYAATLPSKPLWYQKSDYGIWVQRGPGNIGGRSRAICIDKNNENILIAGAASGGIWRSEDQGTSWYRTTSDTDFVPATSIVQDIRQGKTQTWYAGSGEIYGSALPGGYIYGYGVRKSTDGGKSWNRLGTTFSNNPQFDIAFDFVHRLAINTSIDSLDVVFAATYDGIFRSLDGGQTWVRRRGGSVSGASLWSDVVVTKTGVVYAALSAGGHGGIWRSTNNGFTFVNITPAWYTQNCSRIVMGLAPSDENQVYFVAHTPGTGKKSTNFRGDEEWNSLWKYTYKSGDGTGNGGEWEDRSVNIPDNFPGDFGQFITQQGYSMHVDVKPDNPDVVFLGGTNLYRSTDGFKTANNTSQVGGYAVGTKRPDYKEYPNHHPDQHGVIFFPSNAGKALSVDDGGIQLSQNCLAEPLIWTSLNNGFVTTQFYTVAIDHSTTSPILMGGLQDNGTQFTASSDYRQPWVMPYSSDGSFCFIGTNASEYYVSIQEGRVYRLLLNSEFKLDQMARLDPKGRNRSKYQFINPFTPDRNEWKRLYIPNGNTLWRNHDVSQIPLHPQIDSNAVTTGWEELIQARLPDSTDEITAITSSLSQNDMIYFGTQKGQLFKLAHASDSNPVAVNIRGSNFQNGYINCIATDPTDSNKLYCVFSNYAILSVFYSNNGGTSWTAISGNLEQNANGSGYGPSCRWFTVAPLPDSTLYFVGTSTGLFATSKLDGMNTVWSRQGPRSIGYNVVTMMDYRATDHTLAVATYGAGTFTATLAARDHTALKKENEMLVHMQIYPNPASEFIQLDLADHSAWIRTEIYTLNGQKVLSEETGFRRRIEIANLNKGIYLVRIETANAVTCKKILVQ
ncbi:MAG: T9SS type A sorting domain-containing protein [Bacteroidia bacterium]|jgi:hypothetical protein